jgi:hypothetical protein
LAGSTSKKVVAVRFDREPIHGFVSPQTYLQPGGIEVLTSAGNVAILPYAEVKALCFVRDTSIGETWRPNLAFSARPKSEGLWVRFRFRDGDTIEGLVPSNLLAMEPGGFTITSPESARIFLPKAAILETQILGVIGVAAHRSARKTKPGREDQLKMFE